MRHEAVPPTRLSQVVRGAIAQQQVKAGVAQETAEQADTGVGSVESALPPVYADDTAAAAAGLPIDGVYRLPSGAYKARTV